MKTLLQPQTSTFTLANQGKRVTHPVVAVLLSFVIIFISIMLAETFSTSLNPDNWGLEQLRSNQPAVFSALGKIISLWLLNVPIYILLWVWLASFERRPYWTLGFIRQGMFPAYLSGLGIGFIMMSAMVGIVVLFGVGKFIPVNAPAEGLSALGGIMLVCVGWVVQAAAEETVFRGWLLQTVSNRTNVWIGVTLSSLCFAAVHCLNNGFSPLVLCNLVLFGLFLALYRIADGSLWGVCAWHAVWNWALGNIFGADVSGSAPEGGRLLHISLAGPDWLTGGAFGLEGSVATTAIFVIGIVCVGLYLNKKQQNDKKSILQANG
ncbi:CPBP family intramembrane glutamic endopeptidase [Paenibacillus riograndensis]|uniref:CPBP family intramembrane glutamic endopeptidase n=1 Tax=Paenibacillus riograndensis TaxID=483937 RepID=UPI000764AFB2|nr:type II CAAX endopeptidase family protein [Paenibacillus riograndensis]